MTQVVVAQWFSLKLNRNYLLRAWRKRTVKSNTKLSKILGEKNEAPCDDATWNFECGRSRSITKGFLPTIKLVNLSTGGRAEFAPKLCIAYWPQTYCRESMLIFLGKNWKIHLLGHSYFWGATYGSPQSQEPHLGCDTSPIPHHEKLFFSVHLQCHTLSLKWMSYIWRATLRVILHLKSHTWVNACLQSHTHSDSHL